MKTVKIVQRCAYCKRVRQDENRWQFVPEDQTARPETPVGYTICPECFQRFERPLLEALRCYDD